METNIKEIDLFVKEFLIYGIGSEILDSWILFFNQSFFKWGIDYHLNIWFRIKILYSMEKKKKKKLEVYSDVTSNSMWERFEIQKV